MTVNDVHQSSFQFDCPLTLLQYVGTTSDPEVGYPVCVGPPLAL